MTSPLDAEDYRQRIQWVLARRAAVYEDIRWLISQLETARRDRRVAMAALEGLAEGQEAVQCLDGALGDARPMCPAETRCAACRAGARMRELRIALEGWGIPEPGRPGEGEP